MNSLKTLFHNCRYFSLCLDESTDVSDVSHLQMSIRMVDSNFNLNEELCMHNVRETTKGADIFQALKIQGTRFGSFKKFSCITISGAPAMSVREKKFVGYLSKNNNIFCPALHSIIHIETLFANFLKLEMIMTTVTKITNSICGGSVLRLQSGELNAFLIDITKSINAFNLRLQGRNLTIAYLFTVVNGY